MKISRPTDRSLIIAGMVAALTALGFGGHQLVTTATDEDLRATFLKSRAQTRTELCLGLDRIHKANRAFIEQFGDSPGVNDAAMDQYPDLDCARFVRSGRLFTKPVNGDRPKPVRELQPRLGPSGNES